MGSYLISPPMVGWFEKLRMTLLDAWRALCFLHTLPTLGKGGSVVEVGAESFGSMMKSVGGLQSQEAHIAFATYFRG